MPFAPGFASAEQMPDSFDAAISPQTQIILRKLSKKDPMTKKKALQELHELIEQSDVEVLKNILPLWPKYYLNLASDPEHTVREQTQTVLQLLMAKCKKAMAPYLTDPVKLNKFIVFVLTSKLIPHTDITKVTYKWSATEDLHRPRRQHIP